MDAPPPEPTVAPSSPPPRPLTAKARRRSWNEPAVRIWSVMAFAMFLVVAGSLVYELAIARTAQYRILHWQRYDKAKLVQLGDSHRESYRVQADQLPAMPVRMQYVDAKGATHELVGRLTAQVEPVHPTQTIPILVNPANPEQWTDRVAPPPLFEQLLGPLILLPLLVILAIVAGWQRRRVLSLWRTGALRQGTVVDRRHTAVAPRSNVLRCTVDAGAAGNGYRDKRLISVAVPRRAFDFQPGDRIALITPPVPQPDRALAAMMYE